MRRAELLAAGPDPTIVIGLVDGASVTPAAARSAPEPPAIPDDHWALAGVISEAGARPLDDHGQLIGEVSGLEVCRVIGAAEGPRIDVGVGQADRELNKVVHRGAEPGEDLRRVIGAVGQYRRPGSHHPLTRVGRERWLRSLLVEEPARVGAETLEPLVPLRPRRGLRIGEPAAAGGHMPDGQPVVVVTMSGIDLDLVPEAADYRHRWNPDASLVLALPERDLRLSVGLIDLVPDATAVAVATPWT